MTLFRLLYRAWDGINSLFGRDHKERLKREAIARMRATQLAHAAHPVFREFKPLADGGRFAGTMTWCSREVAIVVSCYRPEAFTKLDTHFRLLQQNHVAMDAASRAYIVDAVRDPESNLSRWLEVPPEKFVGELVLDHITLTEHATYALTYLSSMMGGLKLIVAGWVGESIDELRLRGVGLKKGRMPLVLDGDSFAVESAQLGIWIGTEQWDEVSRRWLYGLDRLEVLYSLEIKVDDHSGEDGRPAPMAQSIPVTRLDDGHYPLPFELGGRTISAEEGWDSWLGNDAPEITANEMRFGAWCDGRIEICWKGEYGFRTKESFLFDGDATTDYVGIRVKEEADADAFMTALFGAGRLRTLRREVGAWTHHDASMPKDRRHWLDVKYFLKA